MSRSKKKKAKAKQNVWSQFEKAFAGHPVEPWFKGKFRRELHFKKHDTLLKFAHFLVKQIGHEGPKPKNKADLIAALLPGASDKDFYDWLLAHLKNRANFDTRKVDTSEKSAGKRKNSTTSRRLRAKKIKQASQAFYRSEVWLEMRKLVFAKYGYRCMRGVDCKGPMHVDHIKPRSKFPKLELDFNNLQVLCESCNSWKSNIYYTDFRPGKYTPKKFASLVNSDPW